MPTADTVSNAFNTHLLSVIMWTHLGLNQGPSDYESDALTN
jgi:hypothetical protein